jgi:hypothetical protein
VKSTLKRVKHTIHRAQSCAIRKLIGILALKGTTVIQNCHHCGNIIDTAKQPYRTYKFERWTDYFHEHCWFQFCPYLPVTNLTQMIMGRSASGLIDFLQEYLTEAEQVKLLAAFNAREAKRHAERAKAP